MKHGEHNEEVIIADKVEVIATQPLRAKKDNLSIPLAIVFSGILIAGAILFTNNTPAKVAAIAQAPVRNQVGADTQEATPDQLSVKPDDHVLGNPDADVLIIEYTDAQCPFCQRFHMTMQQVMSNYGKTGQVAWVYRHFPLDSIHPYARKGAEALECAYDQGGNTAFWKLEDKMFAANTASIAPDELPKLAAVAGLDVNAFSTCLTSGKTAARVERDYQQGVDIGVRGTPYTIVWNKKTNKQIAINGAYPYDNVKGVLGQITASAQNPDATGAK